MRAKRYASGWRGPIAAVLVFSGLNLAPALAQVSVAPAPGTLRVACVDASGNLTFDPNSNTTCAGAQTNVTGITANNGGGFTASGTAGLAVTGTGGISTTSGAISSTTGNISTTSGNISAAAGTITGATLTSTGTANVGTNLTVGSNAAVGGTLGVTGATTTNGITNTGAIGTTTLSASGNVTSGGTVQGATLTSTGAANVGTTLSVGGATTTNGITNTGSINTTSLSVGGGGIAITAGAPIQAGGNRIQNVGAPVAPGDAANKAYVDAQLGTSNDRVNEAFRRIDENTQGIAVAIAMTGLALPNGKTFALGANMGFYDNKQALALQSALRLSEVVTLSGGIGVGTDTGAFGARIGFMAAW